jgi:hypothetical protein
MPFTFAHPAIVLPLEKYCRGYFSFTGLIIGSMIPDVEYFIRMKVLSTHSHTFSGLFYFDLPVGVMVYLLFVSFVRTPLITHLPAYLRDRFSCPFKEKNIFIIILSIFIGSVSHVFWDHFTHETGYLVQHIDFLRSSINIGRLFIPVFKILQHSSTLAGTMMIGYYITHLPRKYATPFLYPGSYWIILFLVASLVIVSKYLLNDFISFGDWVVTLITAGLIGIFITSIIYHIRIRYQ